MKKMFFGVLVLGLLLSWSVVTAEDGFYVIPVRNQVTTWDKIIPGTARWTLVLNNEAALDKETGLVWQINTDDITRSWSDAGYYCRRLYLGGRMGWRLPTIEELNSLQDRSQLNPVLPAGHPFINHLSSVYWADSTYAAYLEYAWYVGFYSGDVNPGFKSDTLYVRCVRGGS
jgi:hypothetical protein